MTIYYVGNLNENDIRRRLRIFQFFENIPSSTSTLFISECGNRDVLTRNWFLSSFIPSGQLPSKAEYTAFIQFSTYRSVDSLTEHPWVAIYINPLNPELNLICYLLALLGAQHFLHVSRIRVKLLTFSLLMSHIYGAPILDVSRSHTTTQHSR